MIKFFGSNLLTLNLYLVSCPSKTLYESSFSNADMMGDFFEGKLRLVFYEDSGDCLGIWTAIESVRAM